MAEPQTSQHDVSQDLAWKGIYRAGGASFILAGLLFIIGIVGLLALAPFPSTGKAFLEMPATKSLDFQVAIGSFALAVALFIPGILGLYLALKELGRNYVLVSAITGLVMTSLFLAEMMIYFTVPSLSSEYLAATTESQKAAYIASADLALGVVNTGFIFTGWLFAVQTILVSVVMLRGVFGKGLGYLGIIAGVGAGVGIPGVPGGEIFFLASTILFAVWFVATGWKLYKLGQGS